MNLNVPKILALKANDRMYAVSDGSRENLWMVVFPSGKRSWQYRYRFGGKQKVYTIGPFPAVSLNDARAGLRGADWAAIELNLESLAWYAVCPPWHTRGTYSSDSAQFRR